MFDWMPDVVNGLRGELLNLYWILLTPITLMVIIFEFLKKNLNFKDIVWRVVLSLLLLWSFEEIIAVISFIGNGVVERIDGIAKLSQVLEELQRSFDDEVPGLLKFRQMLIYVINLCCYLVALLSFYITDVLINFVYAVLYVVSPLAFLCMIPSATQNIPKNLYKGIINTVVWKILWSILGVLLLELTRSPIGDWENFFMSALVNLCIGVSMLMIPFFAKSLVSDGLSSAATGLAAATTVPIGKAIASYPLKKGMQATGFLKNDAFKGFKQTRAFAKKKYRGAMNLGRKASSGTNKGIETAQKGWKAYRSFGEIDTRPSHARPEPQSKVGKALKKFRTFGEIETRKHSGNPAALKERSSRAIPKPLQAPQPKRAPKAKRAPKPKTFKRK